MIVIGDLVGEIRELRLETGLLPLEKAFADIAQFARFRNRAVLEDALAALEGEVQAGELRIALLEFIDRAQRLQVVLEAAVLAHALVERVLARMPEGRVAQVVRQRDGFGQCLVQIQRARHRAADLRHLDRMSHARAIQIAFVIDEHLGLVGQATKSVGMDDAIAVALEFPAVFRRRLRKAAPARAGILRRVACQYLAAHSASVLMAPRRSRRRIARPACSAVPRRDSRRS